MKNLRATDEPLAWYSLRNFTRTLIAPVSLLGMRRASSYNGDPQYRRDDRTNHGATKVQVGRSLLAKACH
jgi:hypothetical protein